jgi:hypothetical protein
MNIQIVVSGKRKSGKTTFVNWLASELGKKGADITILEDGTSAKISIVADQGFLAPAITEAVSNAVTEMSALQEAHQIIFGDREQTYGDPGKNLRTIAAYWNIHIQAAKSIDPRLTVEDVAGMMRLLKQARLATNPHHRDSLVDIAGYVGLEDRINSSIEQSLKATNGYKHE